MSKLKRIPVSERALLARLNRHLRNRGKVIKKCRYWSRDHFTLGDYFAVDLYRNVIIAHHIDLSDWAKNRGVIKDYESLAA